MNSKIGQKIRQFRKQRGMSQEQVADYLSITQSTYSRIENGESRTWSEYLDKLCEVLEIEPEELFKTDKLINNNIETNNGVGYAEVANILSEKLISQMEERIQEKNIEIAELKALLERYNKSSSQ